MGVGRYPGSCEEQAFEATARKLLTGAIKHALLPPVPGQGAVEREVALRAFDTGPSGITRVWHMPHETRPISTLPFFRIT